MITRLRTIFVEEDSYDHDHVTVPVRQYVL
jgi:hypothetical protein